MTCRICGSDRKREISTLCSNMGIMGPFFSGVSSRIVVCENCGSVYVDIDVNQDAFTEYYCSEYSKSLSYFEVFGKDEAKVYYENIEKRISKYIGKHSHILEIGGGIGELAVFLQEKGYSDITVMEPSDRCIALCDEKGIHTIKSDCMSIPDNLIDSYDFIIINHTLEHILDFDKVLKNAHKMLKSEGYVYIEVPDAAKYADTNFVPYWFFTYEHIVHMTLDSFDNLARVFGYIVSEKESYLKCHSYNVMYTIMKKSDKFYPSEYVSDVEQAVKRYIDGCEGKLKPITDELRKSQERLILWGVGTSTAQLLNGNFDGCNVVKLIDSNKYRQKVEYVIDGKRLKIDDPSTIDTDDLIVILPLMYDASIRKQISDMGLKNKVQSLIDNYK